ncbi:MAG: hypothetical protein NC300_03310 [Bacteroidales bacterium]|nr:hypothetical protein [Clostridium sp.]MCM1203147.1 hypothetical protein [Bacteroidales bacterium]
MDFLTKLERKYGKFGIPNLTVILIIGFAFGYILEIAMPEALQFINLNPEMVMRGQVYRLVTWIVMPPGGVSLWLVITLMFYFSIGRTLENTWGDFRYTLYIVSGIVFTDLGVMLTYLALKLMGQAEMASLFAYYSNTSTYYLCMSMFLAYAFMFPHMQVLLYFIIPIKVKWLGYLYIAILAVTVLQYGQIGYYAGMVTVIMSVFNFIVFYFLMKGKNRMSPAQKKRKKSYKREVQKTQVLTRHKCAICGQTEEDNPNLEFRYCSRCKGNYEYCNNHLFTHVHKKS